MTLRSPPAGDPSTLEFGDHLVISAVAGQCLGDEAVSDGSNAAAAGLGARWTGDIRQPSDGSDTVSPSR